MILHRKFLSYLGHLTSSGVPAVGGKMNTKRKLVFVEKVVASLLLCRDALKEPLGRALWKFGLHAAHP